MCKTTNHRRDVGTGGLGATKALQHLGGAGRRAGMPRRPIPTPVSIGTTNVPDAVEKIAGTRSSSAAVWRTGLGVALELGSGAWLRSASRRAKESEASCPRVSAAAS